MDTIFGTTTKPRSDIANTNGNPTATVLLSDDSLPPACSASRGLSPDFHGDEFKDDVDLSEGDKRLPLLQHLPTDDVDQLVAQALSKLSLAERQKALYDLHAVMNIDDLRQPSPEIQRSLLQEVQRIIREELPHSDKEIYEQALQIDASYVHNDQFVLKFLRADGWDAKRAAVRLVKHFKVKLELFPLDLLCRDITQDDLDPETLAVLYHEKILDLPLRDMAGRIITVLIPGPGYDVLSKARRIFYATMVKAEDEETQLKGRVAVAWLADTKHGMDAATAWKVGHVMQGLPMKHSAIHVCIPDKQPNFAHSWVLALLGYAMERLLVVRLKCHFGTPAELRTKLQDYGIPSSILPISDSGEILGNEDNLKWAQRRLEERLRRQKPNDSHHGNLSLHSASRLEAGTRRASIGNCETSDPLEPSTHGSMAILEALGRVPFPDEITESLHFVQTPSNSDVLLGRGRLCQDHVGNVRLRQYIGKQWHVFEALPTKGAKTRMADDVVKVVKTEFGGRFLQEKGFGWIEVSDKVARTKVAACFRTFRYIRRKDQDMNSVR